jgi:hypothetical protein
VCDTSDKYTPRGLRIHSRIRKTVDKVTTLVSPCCAHQSYKSTLVRSLVPMEWCDVPKGIYFIDILCCFLSFSVSSFHVYVRYRVMPAAPCLQLDCMQMQLRWHHRPRHACVCDRAQHVYGETSSLVLPRLAMQGAMSQARQRQPTSPCIPPHLVHSFCG